MHERGLTRFDLVFPPFSHPPFSRLFGGLDQGLDFRSDRQPDPELTAAIECHRRAEIVYEHLFPPGDCGIEFLWNTPRYIESLYSLLFPEPAQRQLITLDGFRFSFEYLYKTGQIFLVKQGDRYFFTHAK